MKTVILLILFLLFKHIAVCQIVELPLPSNLSEYQKVIHSTKSDDTLYLLTFKDNPPSCFGLISYYNNTFSLLDTFTTQNAPGFENIWEWLYGFQYYKGKLYISGIFTSINNNTSLDSLITWDPINGFQDALPQLLSPLVYSMTILNDSLIICGQSIHTDSLHPYDLISWDGVNFSSLGNFSVQNELCQATVIMSVKNVNNKLLVCGRFNNIESSQFNSIAEYNSITNNWDSISDIGPEGDSLLLISQIDYFDGNYYVQYSTPNSYEFKIWDGTLWSSIYDVTSIQPDFWPISIRSYSDAIYFVGAFMYNWGIAKWDGNTWTYYFLNERKNNSIEFDNKLFFYGLGSSIYSPICYLDLSTDVILAKTNHSSFYPNPSNGIINVVNIDPGFAVATISIKDLSGKLLMKTYTDLLTDNSIDLSGLLNGTYIISIETEKEIVNNKVVLLKQ